MSDAIEKTTTTVADAELPPLRAVTVVEPPGGGENGAVKLPLASITPWMASPPVTPATCHVGVIGLPLDAAENANVEPAGTTIALRFNAIPPAGAATIVTSAVPLELELVAVIVTLGEAGIEVGAVYKPFPSIEPPPEETLHVKVLDGELARYALNCACPPTGTLTVPGKTVIGPAALGVGVG